MNTKIDELHELIFEVIKGNKPITAIRELVNSEEIYQEGHCKQSRDL